jgi:hypothetical protein
VELISGYLTVTQPTEIALYAQMFARLGEIAVYGSHARDLIGAVSQPGLDQPGIEQRATLRHTPGHRHTPKPTVTASPRSGEAGEPR